MPTNTSKRTHVHADYTDMHIILHLPVWRSTWKTDNESIWNGSVLSLIVYNSSVLGQIWVSGAHGHDNLVDSLVVRHLAAVDSSAKTRRVIVLVGDSDIHATPTGDRYTM